MLLRIDTIQIITWLVLLRGSYAGLGAAARLGWTRAVGGVDETTAVLPAVLRFKAAANTMEYTVIKTTKNDKDEVDELEYLENQLVSSRGSRSGSSDRECRLVSKTTTTDVTHLSGGAAALPHRPLVFWETMVCGAISRSVAQTIMHPANTMKTMLQRDRAAKFSDLARPAQLPRLFVGAGANFILSVPHGAVNFAVLELVRKRLDKWADDRKWDTSRLGPALDFMSSAISTITCSIVSTPQMMITDNIMAGNYPSLAGAIEGLARDRGLAGFYAGWWPGLVGKIPSYALTWTFFQQFKVAHRKLTKRAPKNYENSIMGCLSSAITVTIMIPMDTIKTRLVTQGTNKVYKGIIDCAVKVAKEEGMGAFYRGLPPRLISVVPMIGIQFGVYEFMKKVMMRRRSTIPPKSLLEEFSDAEIFQMSAMEVAASPEHPYPAPIFLERFYQKSKDEIKKLEKEAKKRYDEGMREIARLEKQASDKAKKQLKELEKQATEKFKEQKNQLKQMEQAATKKYKRNKERLEKVEKEAGNRFRFSIGTKGAVPGVN